MASVYGQIEVMMILPCGHSRQKRPRRQNEKGQVAVEYVLLIVVVVAVATVIVKTLVSRAPDDPGFITAKWHAMLSAIGADYPGDVPPEDKNKRGGAAP